MTRARRGERFRRERPTDYVLVVSDGIVLENVTFRYGDVFVLDDQSLTVPRGDTFVITGDHGVGKSTLLYLCAGLVPATSGRVRIGGHDADPEHASRLARAGVRRGFLFQQGGLIANMTVLANVTLPLLYHADLLGLSEAEIERKARDVLEEMGVARSDWDATPAVLSFGERRRVAIARVVVQDPNFVYFDDPDVGLDARTTRLVQRIIIEYQRDPEVTMVLATSQDSLVERLGVPPAELLMGRLQLRQRRA